MHLAFSYLIEIKIGNIKILHCWFTQMQVCIFAGMFLASDRAVPQKGHVMWQTQSLPRQFLHRVRVEFRDAAGLSVIYLQLQLQSTLLSGFPKPV